MVRDLPSNRSKIALATLAGTAIEWYDFFVYGIAAALVFGKAFFPQLGPTTGLLLSFATFGVSFVARPFGGVVAGQIGDRLGRKTVLVFTLMLMGASSVGIGLLPGYAHLGVLAPILLVALRFLQGLAVGGEWGGAAVLAVESAPASRRGLWGSFPQMGGPLGLLLANAATLLTSYFVGSEQFLEWGWRIPFLASAILVVLGLIIRRSIVDPTEAEIAVASGGIWQPLINVLQTRKSVTIALVLVQAGLNIAFYIFSLTSLSYLTKEVGVSRNLALAAVMIGAAVNFCLQPIFGAISDRVGRGTTMIAGNLFLCGMGYLYYQLTATGDPALIVLAMVLGLGVGHAAVYAPLAALLAEQYETTSRYTGVSLANQAANLLWSAPTPFAAIYLTQLYPGSTVPLSLLLISAGAISVIGIVWLELTKSQKGAAGDISVNGAGTDSRKIEGESLA